MSDVLPPAASILCVDDEPRVLDGLKLTLRRGFTVTTATSGAEGLARLKEMDGATVVISDMRMPVMDGADFLARVRTHWPDATRLLLTGETGRDAAVAAVNEGQVFRFLTKPCAPDKLVAAVDCRKNAVAADRVGKHSGARGCARYC
jgi:DNA-binding NtrC family response regulator